MRLADKVALISGAGSGIGRESALLFAREGAKIIVVDIKEDPGRETVASIAEAGGEAAFIQADVSNSTEVEGMIRFAETTYGKLGSVQFAVNPKTTEPSLVSAKIAAPGIMALKVNMKIFR